MLKRQKNAIGRIAVGTIALTFAVVILSLLIGKRAFAETVYRNTETGYRVVIEYDANLLTT